MRPVQSWRLSRAAIVLCLFPAIAVFSYGQTQKVVTVAGGFINDGKPATSAALQVPAFAAMDAKGSLYIADNHDHRIRKVSTTGIISTVAGTGISGFSGDGGSARLAKISFPTGVIVDAGGNIVFSDTGNNRIRQISAAGVITTIAGTGVAGFGGDGGPATAAEINQPAGISIDRVGDLFLADPGNNRIRKINPQGIISTVAGNGTAGYSGDGGPATLASLRSAQNVALDDAGNLYIADTNNQVIRVVDTSQIITTIAGGGGFYCDGDGQPARSADLEFPMGLLIHSGYLFLSDTYCGRIRAVNLTSTIINTVAGTIPGFDGNGHPALQSEFNFYVTGLLLDHFGNLLVVDSFTDEVRKINSQTQIVTDFAGGYNGDGKSGTLGFLNHPEDIAFDAAGDMYIVESGSNRVRKLSATGTLSTIAGTGVSGYTGDGAPAISATLNGPNSVAVDANGNIFVADTSNFVIRKVDTQGIITTYAQDSRFSFLTSLATDSFNNLYIADDCVVWQLTPAHVLSIYAGQFNLCGYNGDGIPATQAQLGLAYGVAFDTKGNLYIADLSNQRIREVDSRGIIHTVAGNGTCGFGGDGSPAVLAELCRPLGVGVDSVGNFYIADDNNRRVRVVNAQGIISTFAGTGIKGYNGNGLLATKTNIDAGVAVRVSPAGIVFVIDAGQARVRKIH